MLEIQNVTAQSEGLYACVVGDSKGSVYSEAYLSVVLNSSISNASLHNTSLKVSFSIMLMSYLYSLHTKQQLFAHMYTKDAIHLNSSL